MTPNEIELRPAVAADAECLSALATQVFLETYATSGIRLALAREAFSQFSVATVSKRLCSSSSHTTVAERYGHLVGFAEVVLDARHPLMATDSAAELSRLYVQSPFVRRGVGRQLLVCTEALAREQGASALWFTSWVGNERALAFYQSQQYEQLGRTSYRLQSEVVENFLLAKTLHVGT